MMSNLFDVDDVKRTAAGQWVSILAAAGMPTDLLDGRGHPCPKCGGTDRFSVFKDTEETGGVMCRQCFSEGNGDGFATIQWFTDCPFPESLRFVAEQVGIQPASGAATRPEVDIVAAVARAKRMPLDAFRQFGAEAAKRGKKPVARVPVYNERGEQHSHFDLTTDGKGLSKTGKGNTGMFFPGKLPQPGETWLIVEGCKDGAALVGQGFNAAGLPRNEMDAKYARLFSGCDVIMVPDLDSAGISGAQRTGGRLAGIAASVRIARLPGEVVKSGGLDVRDVLAKDGEQAIRSAIKAAKPWEPSETDCDDRPEVLITFDEAAVTSEVLKFLGKLDSETPWLNPDEAERATIYQRGGVLVQIVNDSRSGATGLSLSEAVPQIRPLPKSLIRERITQAVQLVEEVNTEDGPVPVQKRPCEWLVQAIHNRGDYNGCVRPLTGITQTPTLRPDGSVIQTPGYDELTGFLYKPTCEFPEVPEHPTKAETAAAVAELMEVIVDFPFETDAHRSVWVALVLTLLVRPAIDGPCPLFVFDANTPGAGKTLLADVAEIIAQGSPMARKTWPGSEEEVRKFITAIAIEGVPSILIDNAVSSLGGPSLDAVLTGTTWNDRILGKSQTTGPLPLNTTWTATGNNLELSADTARRTLAARLNSPEEHPEDRTGFSRPDLKKSVRENRPRLAVAGLTIVRAYYEAGCPNSGLTPWGSFESWSGVVRDAMVFAGLADPCAARDAVRNADQSSERVRLIHAGLEEVDVGDDGLTTADMVRLLSRSVGQDDADPWPCLRAAITEVCGSKIDASRIGYQLRKYLGRVCGGKRLANRKGHGGVKRWFVEPLVPAVISDSGGCNSDEGRVKHELEAVEEPIAPTLAASIESDDDVEVF
tara:strand:+ start:15314 stop:17941 length:2628 start_codon:yes stop_codon:yes gene_type:complete